MCRLICEDNEHLPNNSIFTITDSELARSLEELLFQGLCESCSVRWEGIARRLVSELKERRRS